MDPFETVCSSSPQFDELSLLAAQYRTDIKNFHMLQSILKTNSNYNERRAVDLGVELARCRVLNRHRLERCLAGPVAKETEEFVRRVCIVLRQIENPRHTSHTVARHGIHEFRLLPAVSGIISRAVVKAALLADSEMRVEVANRLVAELDELWFEICLPIIDGERKLLENTLLQTRKLAAFVSRLVQMVQNKKSVETVHAIAKGEFSGVSHMIYRISTDDWYLASRVPVNDLVVCCNVEFDEAIGKSILEWIDGSGRSFHDAIVADCVRIETLSTTSEFAPAWYALGLGESADDPAAVALIEAPQYIGSFNSETGRIYAISQQCASPVRTIGIVRTFYVLRSLIANGSFPIGKFDVAYATELVDREQQVLSFKNSGILSNLLLLCNDFNCNADAKMLDNFVDGLARDRQLSTGQSSFSSCCCAVPSAHTSTSVSSVEPTVVPTPISPPPRNGSDFFIRPDAKHKSIDFWPSKVQRASLLEYLVVYSLATATNEVLSGSRRSLDFAAVGIANSVLVERVCNNAQKLYRTHGSPLVRLFGHADGNNGASINQAALKQMTSHIVKKLLKAGNDGVIAARRAAATGAMNWSTEYKSTRANTELLLHIGAGARDPACYLFLDLCVRVKSYLDESWPLPMGVVWQPAQVRRGGGNGSAARAKAVPCQKAIDDTATTNSL